MPDVVIYGKIIIDDIRLDDGSISCGLLGGGGPQAAFGARLWNDSVGLLSRVGADLEDEHRLALASLDVDLCGVAYYEDVDTLRARQISDGWHVRQPQAARGRGIAESETWTRLLSRPLDLPVTYQRPRVVHLITEYADEPMVATALALREHGVLLSLEPLIDVHRWTNRHEIVALLPHVDLVTPDWPSASGLAGTDDPRRVLECWARLGPRLVAVRNAEHGSYVWSRNDDRCWHIPAVAVRVVDPTGAGNSYGGGLCAGWLRGGDAVQAGALAAVSASFMLEHIGMPSAPERYRVAAQRRFRAIESMITPM
jgi:sugar/nucleoside kinase (ribokinase family)